MLWVCGSRRWHDSLEEKLVIFKASPFSLNCTPDVPHLPVSGIAENCGSWSAAEVLKAYAEPEDDGNNTTADAMI